MSKNYALVIGNGIYENNEKFSNLPYCLNDAKEIYRILTNKEFGIFSPSFSFVEFNVSTEDIFDCLENFFSPITSEDLVLIFFAGHGKTIGSKNFQLILKNSLTENRSLSRTSFNLESLLSYFLEKNIYRYILILDACYAGKALKTPGVRDRGENEEFQAINETFSGEGKIVIASASDYQVAKEVENLNHGLFSFYFIEGIEKGLATNRFREFIDIKEAFDYAAKQLRDKHPDVGQIPLFSGQNISGNIWISKNPLYSKLKENEKTIGELISESEPKKNQLDGLLDQFKKRKELRDKIIEFESLRLAHISNFIPFITSYGELLGLNKEIIEAEIQESLNFLNFSTFNLTKDLLENANGMGSGSWFATLHGSNSVEIPEYGFGIFSYFLREALLGKAANENGVVTLHSAYKYVEARLPIGFDEIGSKQMSILIDRFEQSPILTAYGFTNIKVKSKREGIFIGIDDYLEPNITSLHCAELDAKSISTVLKNSGSFNCTNLFGANATKQRIVKTIKIALDKLTDEDMFIFYFSGHGFSTPENGHLVVYDTNNTDFSTTLSLTEISDLTSNSKVKSILFVFDCCLSPINLPVQSGTMSLQIENE